MVLHLLLQAHSSDRQYKQTNMSHFPQVPSLRLLVVSHLVSPIVLSYNRLTMLTYLVRPL